MKLIDYDAQFNEYMEQWLEKQENKTPEEIEDLVPQAYEEWAEKAGHAFDGKTGEELCTMLEAYLASDIGAPDILLERIGHEADCQEAIYRMFRAEERPEEDRVLLLNLLADMRSLLPVKDCIALIAEPDSESELQDAAAEMLKLVAGQATAQLLDAYEVEEDQDAREKLLYVLVYAQPHCEHLAPKLNMLMEHTAHKALVAGLMEAYGDEECLDALYRAEKLQDIDYIDYTEICNAIEALGGETARDREFNGDEYYDMMKNRGQA